MIPLLPDIAKIHSGEPKNLSNLSSTKPSPSLLFPHIHFRPMKPRSFISTKDLKGLKEDSNLLLPPDFSISSGMSLKSPPMNHLSPNSFFSQLTLPIALFFPFHPHYYRQKFPTSYLLYQTPEILLRYKMVM